TRRALRPLSQTLAASPRFDQAARKGGNSSRSVSSWARTTLRRGRARIWRRIRRFFLALGVRDQVVARALAGESQPLPSAARRVLGDPQPRGTLQDLLEQWHGPARVWVAELPGWDGENSLQEPLSLFVQQPVTAVAPVIFQRRRIVVLRVGLDPVVDALPG